MLKAIERALKYLPQEFHRLALTCVVGAVVVGILVFIALKVRSWYRGDSDDSVNPDQLLLQFRELRRQGGLSEDEYRSIRGRLAVNPLASSPTRMESVDSAGMHLRNLDSDESESRPRATVADEVDSAMSPQVPSHQGEPALNESSD